MRISDWSSDVCSSDLLLAVAIFEFESNGEGVARLWIGIRRRERDPDHQYFAGAETIGALQRRRDDRNARIGAAEARSDEHTSELQSLMRISYAVFCLKKKNNQKKDTNIRTK